jgi:hypothetical protein
MAGSYGTERETDAREASAEAVSNINVAIQLYFRGRQQ